MPVSNSQLAELLAAKGDAAEAGGNKRKALRRASRGALLWNMDAAHMVKSGKSLTELSGVGPYISDLILGWFNEDLEPDPPPPLRRGFLSLTDSHAELVSHPECSPRSDVQMHTIYSDGLGTVEEMVRSCLDIGYQYAAITDHGPALKIGGGVSAESFQRQREEIATLQRELEVEGNTFRILRSAELNLAPDESPDMSPEFASQCDIVLGAFHSRLRRKEDQTERYLAALRNGVIDVLAHPVGRIYNFRLGLSADWDAVMQCAAEEQVAMEIDAYVDRQDLSVELLYVAARHGVYISIGSDSHHPIDLPSLTLGMAAARRAGIRSDRILNLMSVEELLRWRGKRRHL